MSPTELTTTLDDDRIAPVLPLISEAWADGELTELEIAAVCMALILKNAGEVSCNETLHRWLDPDHPPSAEDLVALRRRIKLAA